MIYLLTDLQKKILAFLFSFLRLSFLTVLKIYFLNDKMKLLFLS